MTDTKNPQDLTPETPPSDPAESSKSSGIHSIGDFFRVAEIDTRLLGMLGGAGRHLDRLPHLVGGTFLTPRNLWNLSVQTAAVGIMATGMVLVIVSRNIDLSVGSMLAAIGMAMALLQAEILPDWLGFDHPATWIIALIAGSPRSLIGGFQGVIVAYVGVPRSSSPSAGCWYGAAWRGG